MGCEVPVPVLPDDFGLVREEYAKYEKMLPLFRVRIFDESDRSNRWFYFLGSIHILPFHETIKLLEKIGILPEICLAYFEYVDDVSAQDPIEISREKFNFYSTCSYKIQALLAKLQFSRQWTKEEDSRLQIIRSKYEYISPSLLVAFLYEYIQYLYLLPGQTDVFDREIQKVLHIKSVKMLALDKTDPLNDTNQSSKIDGLLKYIEELLASPSTLHTEALNGFTCCLPLLEASNLLVYHGFSRL